ncbi:hypothetical protein EDC04DRAFT_3094936 [Pisolithus marmoratus]|nr:hypothetical protein EDC04DRAFT_3096756 [Pisolithus marmoratus]KAI6010234.1 hypothetical protein EDC04DRAFT_3094936 [Pisolithus marmoratus]
MSSPTPEEDDFLQSFSILLTICSKEENLKGGEVHEMKELLFTLSTANYIKFLKAVLLKHGLASYDVTEKKHFPLKYIPPKVKGDMVKKLLEQKPLTVKVFVDM